jgi:hypothetical protein
LGLGIANWKLGIGNWEITKHPRNDADADVGVCVGARPYFKIRAGGKGDGGNFPLFSRSPCISPAIPGGLFVRSFIETHVLLKDANTQNVWQTVLIGK